MVCNGDSASIKVWSGNAECSGDATITYTADEMFRNITNNIDVDITLKVECGGSICNYAKVREYTGSVQSTCQDGDYEEIPFVVNGCWGGLEGFEGLIPDSDSIPSGLDLDGFSVKFTCDTSTVSVSVWSNKQCSSDALTTSPIITAEDKCNTVEFCSECSRFMVYSTIFAFIAWLFIE